jgi:hypothetical protein
LPGASPIRGREPGGRVTYRRLGADADHDQQQTLSCSSRTLRWIDLGLHGGREQLPFAVTDDLIHKF